MKKHMFRAVFLAIISFGGLLLGSSRAEVPPMGDAQLQAMAGLIVTGHVVSVSVRKEVHREGALERLVMAYHTVTMTVDSVQKGTVPGQAKQISFVGENNIETPKRWVGGSNTLRIPLHQGDHIKVYLVRQDDSWVLFHHMGIKLLPEGSD